MRVGPRPTYVAMLRGQATTAEYIEELRRDHARDMLALRASRRAGGHPLGDRSITMRPSNVENTTRLRAFLHRLGWQR
jgi:hypothetical protein